MARDREPVGRQPSPSGHFPCNGATVGACRRRTAAIRAGEFAYDWQRRAWIFTTTPPRAMSRRARYFALIERGAEFPHTDHTGEPVTWECCPFCGGLLPDLSALLDEDREALTLPPPEPPDDGN